jgi:2-polyprenyl-3-methyl-5-hydroxy-6-metoxy-1,4-benzoquinol methylase
VNASPGLERLIYRWVNRLVRKLHRGVAHAGERQASPWLSGIRPDHRGRYRLAAGLLPPGAEVLDLACGVGYGSYILASRSACARVVAVDRSEDAIAFGHRHYAHPRITYRVGDAMSIDLAPGSFDAVVSLETIEHVQEDERLLRIFQGLLRPGGQLVLSTPNEERMPFTPEGYRYHVRHYRPADLQTLLERTGFGLREVFSQEDRMSSALAPGWDGLYNVVVCTRN